MEGVDRNAVINLINQTIKKHIDDKGAMCTSYILITEWVDSNGEYSSLTVTDEESPAWRHEGLINYALANSIYETEEGGEE